MPLIIEDEGKLLGKKQAKVPDKLVNKIKQNLNLFGQYKKSKGFKRASSIVDDDYNKRSSKKDKIHNGDKTLSFSDIKKIDHEYKNMSVNDDDVNTKNLGYILPGGNDMKNWAHDTLRKMRTAVKKVPGVPQVPKLEKSPVKPKDVNKDLKMGSATVKLTESIDYFFENYYYDYGASYVFNSFLKNPDGKQNWGVLINPEKYAKALREFTRFGSLTSFPAKYVYQWMGIIMKNTSILIANTDICGHGTVFPSEECEDFLHNYYKDGRFIEVEGYDKITLEVKPSEVIEMCDEENLPVESNDILDYINVYNAKNKSEYRLNELRLDSESNKIYWEVESDELLYKIGITGDWMVLPDGSDGISDYGIEPIMNILKEYDENLPPEKVLVMVNKILDIYHCRGDLSSIFIQGGSKVLSAISEEIKKGKKIIVNENQLLALKEYHNQQVFNFGDDGYAYFEKNNWENYVDFLEDIGTYGMLPASEWTRNDIENKIEEVKGEIDYQNDDISEDDYKEAFLSLVCETFVYEHYDKNDIFEEWFLDLFNDYEEFKANNNYYDECDTLRGFIEQTTDVFNDPDNLDNYLTYTGNMEFQETLREQFADNFNDYGMLECMIINDRGLVYIERNIKIPYFNSPDFDYGHHKNYYNYLKKMYYDLGYCFTWGEGYGEAYCGGSFGKNGTSEIKLKCWVDPKDINWKETVYRNCYSLREEREVYISASGAKIEVFDVVLESGEANGVRVSGKSLLKKPIIIEY